MTQGSTSPAKRRLPPARINLLLWLLLAGITALAVVLVGTLREQQRMAQDLAELEHVKYGLLNADAWVTQFTAIIDKKITEFELTDENRAAFKRSLERMLTTLITEVDRYIRKQNRQGGAFKRAAGQLKQGVQDLLIDMEDVKSAVPQYADTILDEMQKPEARRDLNLFLHRMLYDLSTSTFASVDESRIREIEDRYACEDREDCRETILWHENQQHEKAVALSLALLGMVIILFISAWRLPGGIDRQRLLTLSLSAVVLMACGVLTPMIEVDARISKLSFMVFEEPVVFTEQVLYFQSKSVLDVVATLTTTGAWDMIIVGLLIMSFSVLFPLAKLASSLTLLYGASRFGRNAVVRFFALKSAKWSMADVMVVAIFMAYIGFDGLIGSQLSNFAESGDGKAEILTTNGTSLQIGFFLFLAFCLANLFASTLLESTQQSDHPSAR